jgi:20S proteasome subunit beta 2
MGSGSLAAMAIFEAKYKPGMEVIESKLNSDLHEIRDKLLSNLFTPLFLLVFGTIWVLEVTLISLSSQKVISRFRKSSIEIELGKVDYLRNYDTPNERKFRRANPYKYPRGTTPVLSEVKLPLDKVVVTTVPADSMEL